MIRRLALLDRFALDTTASAATEFALMVPMLVILLFGGAEAGHFVWTQHKLVEAVRDGARYASRLPVAGSNGVCDGATKNISTDQVDQIKLITRTGQMLTGGQAVVPGWTDAQVEVEVFCQAFVDTGIYSDLGENGPMVTVTANRVGYPWLFNGLGLKGTKLTPSANFTLSAKSSAAVIGI